MQPPLRIETQRRFIEQRAEELLERVNQMDEEELRWTVRVFADCLSAGERAAHLGEYSEYWSLEQLRRFVQNFIQQYTELALEDLRSKAATQGTQLAELTNEELQGMSLAKKWNLLVKDPGGLRPDQVRRELARLFMCKSFELFHDVGLSEAVVEFPAYHRVRDALERADDEAVEHLLRMVLGGLTGLNHDNPEEVGAALTAIREAIGETSGIRVSVDQLFVDQMVRLPQEQPNEPLKSAPREVSQAMSGMSAEDLAVTFLVLTDLMSLQEWEEHLLPLQHTYGSLAAIPPGSLRCLLSRLVNRIGDRRITDSVERYRSGRLMVERRVDQGVWKALSFSERLAILEKDNRAMDITQVARHIAKIFFSYHYDVLFDIGFHVDLLRVPGYQDLLNRLIAASPGGPHGHVAWPQFEELTRSVTRMMLELESLASEARPVRLQEIRSLIAAALDCADGLLYPSSREGRA